MDHLELEFAGPDFVALHQIAVRAETQRGGIGRVDHDRCTGYSFEFFGRPGVIEVAMSEKDRFDLQTVTADFIRNPLDFISRIYDDTFECFLATKDVTIGLIRPYRYFSKHAIPLISGPENPGFRVYEVVYDQQFNHIEGICPAVGAARVAGYAALTYASAGVSLDHRPSKNAHLRRYAHPVSLRRT